MPTAQRQHESGLIEQLAAEPHRFQFVQAVRILLRWLRHQGVPRDAAFKRIVRFRNSLSLAFPPSEIEALDIENSINRGDTVQQIAITPAFFGLLGVSGALPLHYTEQLAGRPLSDRNSGPRAFLDLLSHRLVAQYFLAWCKYRTEQEWDLTGRDALRPLLLSLAGRPASSSNTGRQDDGSVMDDAIASYAAAIRTRPVSGITLSRILSEYVGVPVRLEEFVGCWDPVPANRRSTLGTSNPKLGHGAMLGTRLWRQDLRVALHIGPLNKQAAPAFLPDGKSVPALERMLGLFATSGVQVEARLHLDTSCIAPLVLTTMRSDRKRLGWDTFLTRQPGVASRPQVRFLLHPNWSP